ncbi:MAG: pyruvate carboxylase subunit B [Nitrospirae bacterium]|nr:pyruvate carboxylase subunit B [Nitrospirota bacterium]
MERKVGFIDLTLRDAHQCLWSTRMTTEMMTPILSRIDKVGYSYINIMGGAVFDVCVRYLHENPWHRIKTLCQHLKTPADGLIRGQSLYTFELFPDDIVALNVRRLAANGITMLTTYDALNDNRNLISSVSAAREIGMMVNAMMVYTLSPVHTDSYYQERTRELIALGADHISIKDPTGLLTPERARTLFPAVYRAANGTPIQLHSHCQSGLAPEVYVEAMKNGFSFLHTAVLPLANGASMPAVEEIHRRACEMGIETALDTNELAEVSGYFNWLCHRERKPKGKVAEYNPALYEHQVPGGMISNLKFQLQSLNIGHRLPEILEEASRIRKDLGYPIVVSPFAQYVVTQAVLNVVQGERYKTIPDEIRKYAMGYYGKLAAPLSEEFMDRADIKPEEMRSGRPGEYIPAWVPRLRSELGAAVDDDDLLLAAFYNKELLDPLKKPAAHYTYRTSPLIELIRYIGKRSDLSRAHIKFAGIEITVGS